MSDEWYEWLEDNPDIAEDLVRLPVTPIEAALLATVALGIPRHLTSLKRPQEVTR